MKFLKKIPRLFSLSLFCAISMTVVRISLTIKKLDVSYGVYRQGEFTPTFYHIMLALISVALIVNGILTAKWSKTAVTVPKIGDFSIFSSCISGFMLIASTVLSLYNILVSGDKPSLLQAFMLIFSIPAAVFFFALTKSKVRSRNLMTVLSFFPTAWCAAYLIIVYFDASVLYISPNRILHHMALLSIMVYFLAESRYLLDDAKPWLFCAAGSVAPMLILVSAVPNMILPSYLSIADSDSFICYAAEAVMALFILSRLYSAEVLTPSDETKPE